MAIQLSMVNQNIILGLAVAFVFSLHGGQNRLNTSSATAIVIAHLKARRDLFVNDAFADRIGQDAFQSVTNLQKHLVVLGENEKHRTVVIVLLSHFPRTRHAYGVILDGRVRLQRRINGDEDLVGALPLEIFQRAV